MKYSTILVAPYGRQWQVRYANSKRILRICKTQNEAYKHARRMAIIEGLELIVFGINGQIVFRNSYGNDPIRRRG